MWILYGWIHLACSKETQHLTYTPPQFNLLLYFLRLVYFYLSQLMYAFKLSPHYAFHHSAILHNVEVLEPCGSAAGKTSMMQLCCHLRVTNRQWQTIRKGGESRMVSLTNCYDLWVLWPPECKAHAVFTSGQQQCEHAGPPRRKTWSIALITFESSKSIIR